MDTVNVKPYRLKKFSIEKSSFPLKNKVNLIFLDFTKISPGFHQELTRSSPRFHQDFTKISPGVHQDFTKIPPGFHQDFTRISPGSPLCDYVSKQKSLRQKFGRKQLIILLGKVLQKKSFNWHKM